MMINKKMTLALIIALCLIVPVFAWTWTGPTDASTISAHSIYPTTACNEFTSDCNYASNATIAYNCSFSFIDAVNPWLLANITWWSGSESAYNTTWDDTDVNITNATTFYTPQGPAKDDVGVTTGWKCNINLWNETVDEETKNGTMTTATYQWWRNDTIDYPDAWVAYPGAIGVNLTSTYANYGTWKVALHTSSNVNSTNTIVITHVGGGGSGTGGATGYETAAEPDIPEAPLLGIESPGLGLKGFITGIGTSIRNFISVILGLFGL